MMLNIHSRRISVAPNRRVNQRLILTLNPHRPSKTFSTDIRTNGPHNFINLNNHNVRDSTLTLLDLSPPTIQSTTPARLTPVPKKGRVKTAAISTTLKPNSAISIIPVSTAAASTTRIYSSTVSNACDSTSAMTITLISFAIIYGGIISSRCNNGKECRQLKATDTPSGSNRKYIQNEEAVHESCSSLSSDSQPTDVQQRQNGTSAQNSDDYECQQARNDDESDSSLQVLPSVGPSELHAKGPSPIPGSADYAGFERSGQSDGKLMPQSCNSLPVQSLRRQLRARYSGNTGRDSNQCTRALSSGSLNRKLRATCNARIRSMNMPTCDPFERLSHGLPSGRCVGLPVWWYKRL